jgi:hypothetical protein
LTITLYVFLESDDDERFFSKIIFPLLRRHYNDDIEPILYAEEQPKETRKYLRSLERRGEPYIFTIDLDPSDCLVDRKHNTACKYGIDPDRVAIVCKEIESWYLSGLKQCDCSRLGMQHYAMTDDICKETFERMIPDEPKIIIMSQMLRLFDIQVGKQKNLSFRYFFRKWIP